MTELSCLSVSMVTEKSCKCNWTYAGLPGLDVVGGEYPAVVADAPPPPLTLPLRHQDDVTHAERQVPHLRTLVRVQGHKLCLGQESLADSWIGCFFSGNRQKPETYCYNWALCTENETSQKDIHLKIITLFR